MSLTAKQTVTLRAYQAVMHLGLPLGLFLSCPWLLAKTKRRRTVFRRLGFQRLDIPQGPRRPLWIHALSLGETLSCVTLVKELRSRLEGRPLVFSVSTLAAREMAEERLAGEVDALFYFPFDLAPSVGRVLRRVAPAYWVAIETDIWPGFQHALARRGIPAALVNARLSPQSLRSCQRFNALFAPALNAFDTVFPQSEGEAERYRRVGLMPEKIAGVGNLKFDAALAEPSDVSRADLCAEYGLDAQSPVWVVGSTHLGEERVVAEVYRRLCESLPKLQLVLVPRHPRRGGEVRTCCEGQGLKVRLFSEGKKAGPSRVLVVDAMGRLASLYRTAGVAFIGGSLVSKGGQNPIEPAAAGVPVVFGSDMSDFPDISRELLTRGAAFQVTGAQQLFHRVQTLLRDERLASEMGRAGMAFVAEHRGVTRRVADSILESLPEPSQGPCA